MKKRVQLLAHHSNNNTIYYYIVHNFRIRHDRKSEIDVVLWLKLSIVSDALCVRSQNSIYETEKAKAEEKIIMETAQYHLNQK